MMSRDGVFFFILNEIESKEKYQENSRKFDYFKNSLASLCSFLYEALNIICDVILSIFPKLKDHFFIRPD